MYAGKPFLGTKSTQRRPRRGFLGDFGPKTGPYKTPPNPVYHKKGGILEVSEETVSTVVPNFPGFCGFLQKPGRFLKHFCNKSARKPRNLAPQLTPFPRKPPKYPLFVVHGIGRGFIGGGDALVWREVPKSPQND